MDAINHVGIIPDGNRRWAKREKVPFIDAYATAMKKLRKLSEYLINRYNVKSISIYGLSKENLNRDSLDLEAVFKAESYFCNELLPSLVDEYECQIVHAGLTDGLPDYFVHSINSICQKSKNCIKHKIYLAINYNPIDELNSCCFAASIEISRLWVPETVDLIIRSANGRGISNFLPLQSGYSIYYFAKPLFPDMTESDIDIAVTYLLKHPRQFGK